VETILPKYPHTPHLPYKVGEGAGWTCSTKECQSIFETELYTYVEEKVDGANCAMMLYNGEPVIRNREHILRKGYAKKGTSAKVQFRPAWNWFYDNKKKFQALNKIVGNPTAVYGEWLWALHGVVYKNLPSYFMPYDIYVHGNFIDPHKAKILLRQAGFDAVPILAIGAIPNWTYLENLCNEQSVFGPEQREGVYLKQSDGQVTTKRFKMVRSGYIQGLKWSSKKITKQKTKK